VFFFYSLRPVLSPQTFCDDECALIKLCVYIWWYIDIKVPFYVWYGSHRTWLLLYMSGTTAEIWEPARRKISNRYKYYRLTGASTFRATFRERVVFGTPGPTWLVLYKDGLILIFSASLPDIIRISIWVLHSLNPLFRFSCLSYAGLMKTFNYTLLLLCTQTWLVAFLLTEYSKPLF
jgi:hypothetical protein